MKKQTYYVTSGLMKEAVVATSPKNAITSALMRAIEKEMDYLGEIIYCSTHSFFSEEYVVRLDDLIVNTRFALKKMGLLSHYRDDYGELDKPEEYEEDQSYLDDEGEYPYDT